LARTSVSCPQISTRIDGGASVDAAGQVETIFRHRYREALSGREVVRTYFAIKRYCELEDSEALQDPYREYPYLSVRLRYDKFETKPYVIAKEEVIAHIATCPVQEQEKELMVIVSLDGVRMRVRPTNLR
jgi:hypothetical protein